MADHRPDSEPGTNGTVLAVSNASDHHRAPLALSYRVSARVRSETGEVASWLILMAGLVVAAAFAAGMLTFVITELTRDVVDAAEVDVAVPEVPRPEPSNPDVDANGGAGGAALPTETLHCSLTVTAGGGLVGLGVDVGGTVEVIIQTLPDGTQIVTLAGDVMAGGGPSTSAGVGVTVNDATVGAYAAASAEAWGSVGAGVQYELAPGETLTDLFAGLAVSSNPVTGIGATVVNGIFPGDPIPTADRPNTVFVDIGGWGEVGGTAQAGVGFVSVGANGNGQVGVNQAYAIHKDGTYSAITTYAGELNGDAGGTGGIPFFAWGQAGIAVEAQGSISVETIYDSGFNPVSMVVTTSYGYDGDAILGSDDDDPTITTQQWTLDLTDPETAAAVNNLDALTSGPTGLPTDIPTENPFDSWDTLSDNATTTGPTDQQLSTSELDIAFEAGAIVAEVSGGLNGTCTRLQ